MTHSKKRPKGFDGFAVRVAPAPKGFRLLVKTRTSGFFKLEYFAIGAAGHQRRGLLEGAIRSRQHQQFVNLRFDVILVGITDAMFWADGKPTAAASRLESPPRGVTLPEVIPSTYLSAAGAITKLTIARRPGRSGLRAGRYRGTYDLYDLYGDYGQYDIYGGRADDRPNDAVPTLRSDAAKTGGRKKLPKKAERKVARVKKKSTPRGTPKAKRTAEPAGRKKTRPKRR
jgi:hypothetical protein